MITYIIAGAVLGIFIVIVMLLIFARKNRSGISSSVMQMQNFNSMNNPVSNEELIKNAQIILRSGNKIEAIKYIIKSKKMSLLEGKEFIENLQQQGFDPIEALNKFGEPFSDLSKNPDLISQMRALLRQGKKIHAIKLVVANKKIGLKEAKDFVDQWEARNMPK